jgi:hypothetical protein
MLLYDDMSTRNRKANKNTTYENEQLKKLFMGGRHISVPVILTKQQYMTYPNPKKDPVIDRINKDLEQINKNNGF